MIATPVVVRADRRAPALHAARARARLRVAAARFFLILVGMIAAYLVLVEFVKARFYAVQDRPRRTRPTHTERHHRHIRRRAARFAHHPRTIRPAG